MKAGSVEGRETSSKASTPQRSRGIAIFDFILRIFALVGTLGSAAAMGTTDETLSFNTQFFQFQAEYDDFDAFKLFVIVNAIACGYFVVSLPISIYHIVRRRSKGKSWILLTFLDASMLALLTGAASAAAAIVYLAHNGNSSANWPAVCLQFRDYCQRSSGALIGSFGAIVALVLMIFLSSVALYRH